MFPGAAFGLPWATRYALSGSTTDRCEIFTLHLRQPAALDAGLNQGVHMARKSGAGGGIFFVIGVVWLMSKCAGGGNSASTEPVPIAESAQVSTPFVEATETMYVDTAGLNQRSRPSGPVISKLSRGESVNVYERSGTWARVSADGVAPLWVSSSHLCSGVACATEPAARIRPATQSRRSKLKYVDDTCPCSGSRVCIGPRGGRFCITSGGNKRYGV